ncbi:MAG TPA: DUF1338 domain-containing protein [Candidatus Sphingobacterium stercorigallinarum]|nr:DUF1338 domain-containing protein [Candidatus Sphingobacterium stercorigallinarum]
MYFNNEKPVDIVINDLFEHYRENVSDVDKITRALLERGIVGSQQEIVNDHIAFRTLGVPHLGIASFEKIFLSFGFKKMDYYHFPAKKLDAYWYAPPSDAYPRIFVSELRVEELSPASREIIFRYTGGIKSDPVDQLDLNNGSEVAAFLQQPLWSLPTSAEYQALLAESEYAAWVIYNRYYLNHYTISIHDLKPGYSTLEEFNSFLEGIGITLNTAGGKIKTSDDGLLRQSSTVSAWSDAQFADGETLQIAGSYVEFAERSVLPEFKNLAPDDVKREHRRDGFEANNADKIFESTYSSQVKK